MTDLEKVFGTIKPPTPVANIGSGAAGISNFLSRIIELIFIVGGITFLFMVVFGALQWIMSGGDKEAVGKARNRITHAIIGIALLSLSFVIIKLIGQITGFEFFVGQNTVLPHP